VIVTLIFLIAGIRENTEITRAAAFDRNMESINQWRVELAKDPEMTGIWLSQGTPEKLNEVDQFRLIMLHGSLWGIYEKSYYAQEYGVLGPSEWSRFQIQMCARKADMRAEDWANLASNTLTERFAGYAERLCVESP
jgi:hypothetical protein